MLNRTTNTPILLLVFALVLASMGARLETSSVISTEPPMFSDSLDIIEPILEQERTIQGHFLPQNLIQRLRKQFRLRNFNPYFETEKTNMIVKNYQSQVKVEQGKNNLGSMILSGLHTNLLVINQSIILTTSASKNNQLTLNFVDLVKKTKNSKVYPQIILQSNVSQNLALNLMDQRTLGIYSGQDFIVIDIPGWAIRQKLQIHGIIPKSSYRIDVHFKNEAGNQKKTVLLQSEFQNGYILQLDQKNNQYFKVEEIYTPNYNLYLTGFNQGISAWSGKKVPVDFLNDFPILDQAYDKIPPGFHASIVASNSEEMVAILYEFPAMIIFNSLDKKANYEMNYLFNITVPIRGFVTDNHKVRFTNDDKFLFLALYQNGQNYRCVGVVDTEKAKATFFDIDGENKTDFQCFDYGILSNSQFVLVCQKNQWKAQNLYQLRLYNISNFKVLDKFNVTAESATLQIKTNPNFNSTFILQTLSEERKSNLRMFKIVNNKIASTTIPANFTNFKIFTDCLHYLMGVFEGEAYHSFVNIKNFEVVKKTPINSHEQDTQIIGLKYYFVQKSMLAIGNYKMYQFYDLSKLGTGEEVYLCNFYCSNSVFYFLPNQKYVFKYDSYSLKVNGYNLQKCPTKNLIPLDKDQNLYYTFDDFLYRRVPESLQKPGKLSCNVGYLLKNRNTILTFQDCEPYKTTTTIISVDKCINEIRLSSNNKYLILTKVLQAADIFFMLQLDVRLISDLATSVYKTKKSYNVLYKESDVTKNDELVYTTPEGLFYEKMNSGKEIIGTEATEKEEGEIESLTE